MSKIKLQQILGLGATLLISLVTQSVFAESRRVSPVTANRLKLIDRDGDGLPDLVEKRIGTNPQNRDSNHDQVWDGDEKVPGLGMSLKKAFQSGLFYGDDEAEDGSDDDDAEGSHSSTRSSTHRPQVRCTRANQRNCIKSICKARSSKNCRPAPRSTPRPISPTSIPGRPNPTPRPAPTTPASGGNFDAQGNTTKFGIPAGLVGNINAGSPIWSNTCSGCHGSEKTNRSFGQLKASLNIGAMSFIRLSDAQLANLTAYLNRSQR